ncbi:hypothetical protein M103_1637 [Bacteroides fragilis str. 1007-1-F |nr:hypothetical protein M103_1637 [Bacteroides fragilis str. 1007-1-F \
MPVDVVMVCTVIPSEVVTGAFLPVGMEKALSFFSNSN